MGVRRDRVISFRRSGAPKWRGCQKCAHVFAIHGNGRLDAGALLRADKEPRRPTDPVFASLVQHTAKKSRSGKSIGDETGEAGVFRTGSSECPNWFAVYADWTYFDRRRHREPT